MGRGQETALAGLPSAHESRQTERFEEGAAYENSRPPSALENLALES